MGVDLNDRDGNRDGNWIDKFGCCKVCDGEIPYGHTDKCDIYKMECEIRSLKSRIEIELALEQCVMCKSFFNPSLIESGECIFCTLKKCKEELIVSRSDLKLLRDNVKVLVEQIMEHLK